MARLTGMSLKQWQEYERDNADEWVEMVEDAALSEGVLNFLSRTG